MGLWSFPLFHLIMRWTGLLYCLPLPQCTVPPWTETFKFVSQSNHSSLLIDHLRHFVPATENKLTPIYQELGIYHASGLNNYSLLVLKHYHSVNIGIFSIWFMKTHIQKGYRINTRSHSQLVPNWYSNLSLTYISTLKKIQAFAVRDSTLCTHNFQGQVKCINKASN